MRTITIQVTSDDNRLCVQHCLTSTEARALQSYPTLLEEVIEELNHRLSILEQQGPWKPQNLVEQTRPLPDQRITREQFKTWGDKMK